tara:strand:+ start:4151 stop:4684 length:534 start_codon:yes stop_codon:yes gene_type:complete
MATYDLTAKSTTGVSSDSTATLPGNRRGAYVIEKELDVAKLVTEGTFSNVASGDIFQLLEVPANTIVIAAGAEVTTAFTGSSAAADIDFAEGDDIVDGGDLTSTGYLAAGTNGQANIVNTGAANTYTALISTADTIDVKISVGDANMVSGVLRVYAVLADISSQQTGRNVADRDLLA